MLTFATLQSQVLQAIVRTDRTASIQTSINLALTEISKKAFWKRLRLTADLAINLNDTSVSLPPDFHNVTAVTLVDNTLSWPMEIRSREWVVQHFPNPQMTTSGKPLFCYIEGQVMYILPTSSGSYTARVGYNRLHPALVNAGDTPLIDCDDAIISFAAAREFMFLQDFASVQAWNLMYEKALKVAILDDAREPGKLRQQEPFPGQRPSPVVEPWLDPFAGHNVQNKG